MLRYWNLPGIDDSMKNIIIYEQPLNEIIRVCLRLEQLFQQIDHQLPDTSELGMRNIIAYIINVLHILDRPDLKSKLAKEMSHHLSNLMRFSNAPDIDQNKFSKLTKQLDEHARALIDSSGKIGHRLRDIELLNMLRLQLASPGGGCSFDIPLFHYWLAQPAKARLETINEWLNEFAQIRSSILLVLEIVRKNAKIEEKTAIHGFHQELLDPQSNLRMMRVFIPNSINAYPEISVGRHFLGVRFYAPTIAERPAQFPDDITFELAYCH